MALICQCLLHGQNRKFSNTSTLFLTEWSCSVLQDQRQALLENLEEVTIKKHYQSSAAAASEQGTSQLRDTSQ